MSAQHGRPSRLPLNRELAEALRGGAAIAELAARYDVSESLIRGRLNDAGWGSDGHPNHKPPSPLVPVLTFGYPDWMERALCAQVGGDGFFPEKGGLTEPARNAVSIAQAKRTCGHCEVRQKCLEYALENDERFGLWGGLSERERRKLQRDRQAAS